MKQLQELFALPINLRVVHIQNGIPLYGSISLNENFIKAIKESNRGKIISNRIDKLVNSGIIIPCYADSNLITHLIRKISRDSKGGISRILRIIISGNKPLLHPLDNVFGFYDFESNKIIILINNHIPERYFIESLNDSIVETLTHEMMHMFAHQKPNELLKLFENELNLYYLNYFSQIFKLKEDKSTKNISKSIYEYLFTNSEINENSIDKDKLIKMLSRFKKYSDLNNDEFNKMIDDYAKVGKFLFETTDTTRIIKVLKNYNYLIDPLYDSYKNSFGKIPRKGCAQELIFPSEVICGYSDIRLDSKVKSALESIN